mmetsp:Transcript_74932/g.212199  ORF Transcript_74932/g.212199 Transcript_74932/m.212199 type:complete len:486 (-) Transcript_74932:1114-2571(-)
MAGKLRLCRLDELGGCFRCVDGIWRDQGVHEASGLGSRGRASVRGALHRRFVVSGGQARRGLRDLRRPDVAGLAGDGTGCVEPKVHCSVQGPRAAPRRRRRRAPAGGLRGGGAAAADLRGARQRGRRGAALQERRRGAARGGPRGPLGQRRQGAAHARRLAPGAHHCLSQQGAGRAGLLLGGPRGAAGHPAGQLVRAARDLRGRAEEPSVAAAGYLGVLEVHRLPAAFGAGSRQVPGDPRAVSAVGGRAAGQESRRDEAAREAQEAKGEDRGEEEEKEGRAAHATPGAGCGGARACLRAGLHDRRVQPPPAGAAPPRGGPGSTDSCAHSCGSDHRGRGGTGAGGGRRRGRRGPRRSGRGRDGRGARAGGGAESAGWAAAGGGRGARGGDGGKAVWHREEVHHAQRAGRAAPVPVVLGLRPGEAVPPRLRPGHPGVPAQVRPRARAPQQGSAPEALPVEPAPRRRAGARGPARGAGGRAGAHGNGA